MQVLIALAGPMAMMVGAATAFWRGHRAGLLVPVDALRVVEHLGRQADADAAAADRKR